MKYAFACRSINQARNVTQLIGCTLFVLAVNFYEKSLDARAHLAAGNPIPETAPFTLSVSFRRRTLSCQWKASQKNN